MSGLSILPTGHMGTPCASMLRQQVRGFIHKSPGQPHLEVTLHAGEQPSCVGPEQSALAEGDACAGQNEPRSRHVVKKQHLFRGIDVCILHDCMCGRSTGAFQPPQACPKHYGRS